MDINNTSLPTTIGDGSKTVIYDNIKRISDLHRAGFSDIEMKMRTLKYTLVTATEKGYDILDSQILNSLESERKGEFVYDKVAPFGDLFEKRKRKHELLYGAKHPITEEHIPGLMEINPKLGTKLKDMADTYIRTMIGMIGEYESYIKENSQEKSSKDLKSHYANLREGYKNSLKGEKDELLKLELSRVEKFYADLMQKYKMSTTEGNKAFLELEQQKRKAKWNHGFLIKNLEYLLSDGLLIGRHVFCQIPLEDKPNSEVSGLQGIISFDEDNSLNKERKIRYNNLGFNIGNIIRLEGKDKDSLETRFDEEPVGEVQEIIKKVKCRDCLIDLDNKNHQLSIALFGKAIPIVGNGDEDERFIQALISKAVKKSQYYLALELPSSSF